MHPCRYSPGKEECSAQCNDQNVRKTNCYYAAALNIAVIPVTEVAEESSWLMSNWVFSHGGSSSATVKRGLSLGFIQNGLNHFLAVLKIIYINKFHANPVTGNK